jgi:hypothetical protein
LDIEWSLDVKAVVLIEFSLSWLTLPFISVDNLPLLGNSTIWLLIGSDVFALNVLVIED